MTVEKTVKFEVVIGVPDDKFVNGKNQDQAKLMINKWQEYAKEYYDATDVYVSAIANEGRAIYHKAWGCPDGGERTLTFNCTANREFITDLELYIRGIDYIVAKLKKEFNQHTVTMTELNALVHYFTDEDNDLLDSAIMYIKEYSEEEE